jgi:hypothetical protein
LGHSKSVTKSFHSAHKIKRQQSRKQFFVPVRSTIAMKIQSKLLALCLFQTTVATAFVVQTPKGLSFAGSKAMVSKEYADWYPNADQTNAYKVAASSTALKDANVSETGTSVGMNRPSMQEASTPFYGAAMRRGMDQQPNAPQAAGRTKGSELNLAKSEWDASQIILQGGSLRTWSETTGSVERVQVMLKTEGRPLNSNVELWHGPDNTPLKMSIYSEDGGMRPFSVVIETPRGQNTIAIRNTGQMEFPLNGLVNPDVKDVVSELSSVGTLKTMQGGAIQTYPFDHTIGSVQVLLETGGRPLNARIELLQGPNNDKMVIDIYTEDGLERPFFAIIETPGTGNVVRVVNTAPVEFPLTACVMPYMVDANAGDESGESGWDNGGATSFLPWGRKA